MNGGGRIRGGQLCAGAILSALVLALHAASAVAASCPVSNVASYSGTVSLSYANSVSNVSDGNGGTASESMNHSGDDLTTGPMTPDKADQDFTSTSLSGTVHIDDHYSDTNNGHTTTASLTGDNAPDSGSDASISFVSSSCVYSISTSVGAAGTHSGVFTDPGISDAASSPNMPIPSDLDLSGSITIQAYGTGPLTLPGIEAGFYEFGPFSSWASEMAQLLGVDSGSGDLGPAQLSWNFTPTFKTKVCDVPTVVGKSLSDAKTALTKANCAAGTITQQASTTVPKGDVISISPVAGTLDPAGTKVNLVESSGPPPKHCVVPTLAGETLAAAKTALKAANCAEGTVTKKASSTVPKGDVISSSPAAGTTHAVAAKVALTISSGKAKPKSGGKAPTKTSCKVPALKGKTLAAAKNALKKADCGVGKVKKATSAKVANGKVISSTPGKGAKKKAGAKVALTVSKGKKASSGKGSTKVACKVPALKGKTLAAAKKALKKANCAVGTVTNKPSAKVSKGKVISSKPGSGAKRKAGAKVALKVSSGKKKAGGGKGSTNKACKVPALKGKTLAAAKKALKKAQCGVGAVTKKASSTVAKGKVISSSPKAGTKHKAGTKVKLTVSGGKTGTTPKKSCVVPNVVGDTLAAAKAALKNANCSTGTVTNKASATVAKGDVVSSSPKAGTKHKAGTKVKLTVSGGPAYKVPKS